MQETAELMALDEGETPFPSLAFPDLREALGRVEKGAVLEPTELRDLSIVLRAGLDVRRYLDRRAAQAPALWTVAGPLAPFVECERLLDRLDRTVDPDGGIKESASPDLRHLTHQAQDLKAKMRQRLETILAATRYADVLQERYFAQREGRYVVLVKAELRSRIPGIVHDVSASGATVFFEPRELVELNNAIKVAELEVEREVRRILHEIAGEVAPRVPMLSGGLQALATLDGIAAKAGLARLTRARCVAVNDRGRIVLKQARHPLLVLSRERVVANDLVLDESVRVLVVSGPNTGGKTVALKLIGLAALMARAGLPIPCGEGSEMALFPDVYADIGDAQDLAKDLSSFSAHMTRMIRLLREARPPRAEAGAPAGALVLLDEPVTSTDPAEGAALAEALLVRLAELGMTVVATTHYNQLKALATSNPLFRNASVEFDVSRLAPTYRFLMDVPGGSSAIEIAGRLGMDEAILERAHQRLKQDDRLLERMLADLQEKHRRLSEEVEQATILREQADAQAREAREIAERLRASERDERKSTRKKLTADLLHARAQVQSVLDSLKTERTLLKAKEAKQRLADIEAEMAAALLKADETVPVETLEAGAAVEVRGLGALGTLLEAPGGKKRVRIKLGDAEMSVATDQLIGVKAKGTHREQAGAKAGTAQIRATREGGLETSSVLDLRGRLADEALDATVAELDRCAMDNVPLLRIIHGHGTGRLKAVLREYLKRSPYVAAFRPGDRSEGGDGVTIVELR